MLSEALLRCTTVGGDRTVVRMAKSVWSGQRPRVLCSFGRLLIASASGTMSGSMLHDANSKSTTSVAAHRQQLAYIGDSHGSQLPLDNRFDAVVAGAKIVSV